MTQEIIKSEIPKVCPKCGRSLFYKNEDSDYECLCGKIVYLTQQAGNSSTTMVAEPTKSIAQLAKKQTPTTAIAEPPKPQKPIVQLPKESPPAPVITATGKNPDAVALGRLGGLKSKGSYMKSLTPKQRSEHGKRAVQERWAREREEQAKRRGRIINALMSNNITTIEQLKTLSGAQLKEITGIGAAGRTEIANAIMEYNATLSPKIIKSEVPQIDEISRLDLPAVTRNALHRVRIYTIEQLKTLSEKELEGIRGIGGAGKYRIETVLKALTQNMPVPEDQTVSIRNALNDLARKDSKDGIGTDKLFDQVLGLLNKYLKEQPVETVKILLPEASTFTVDDLMKAAYTIFIEETLGLHPEMFEPCGSGTWKLKETGYGKHTREFKHI